MTSVREIRDEDPGIGCHKLWLMMVSLYGSDYVMGRDSFINLKSASNLNGNLNCSKELEHYSS